LLPIEKARTKPHFRLLPTLLFLIKCLLRKLSR
jgi:hypothetical protein